MPDINNNVLQVPLWIKNAPFWKRMVAVLIDTFILFLLVTLVGGSGDIDSDMISYGYGSFIGALIVGPVIKSLSLVTSISILDFIVFLMLFVYYAYCLLSELAFKNTIGKFVLGIKMISAKTGEKPSNIQIIIRTLCRLIPFDGFSFFSKNPRGWHDLIPGLKIVKK